MRLIDADTVSKLFDAEFKETIKLICEGETHLDNLAEGFCEAYRVIQNMPTIDAVPVMHSYWEAYSCSQYMGTDELGEPKWRDGRFYVCHNRRCRRKTVVKSNYCPNCGAKMDLEENNEDI